MHYFTHKRQFSHSVRAKMAPAQSEITEAHVESEVSQQGAGAGYASLGGINEEWKDGDRQVRLPKIDLRQPKREVAA